MAAPDAHIFHNLINQLAQEHDVDLNVDHVARRNLMNQFAREHDVDHHVLRNFGLFLVFIGASIIMGAIPQRSDISEDIFMAFTAFALGVLLISLSLVVHVIPRAAAFVDVVDVVLNHSLLVINAICLIDL